MTHREWKKLIRSVPLGFSYRDASRYIRKPYHRTREWMIRLGRTVKAERHKGHAWKSISTRDFWSDVDWKLRNVDICRLKINPATGKPMSRERVRQARKILGHPKVGKTGSPPKIVIDNGR